MNIFVLDINPILSAQYLCDKHVNKAGIIEPCQLLHAALFRVGYKDDRNPYNPNGRFAKWAATSRVNFEWLVSFSLASVEEFKFRFGKSHQTEERIISLSKNVNLIPDGVLTAFVRSETVSKDIVDTVDAYRNYYMTGKRELCKWEKGRDIPVWWS